MKVLKSELTTLDRIIAQALSQKEITAALTPKKEEHDGDENKQHSDTQRVEVIDNQSQATDPKETMVAEPVVPGYHQQREPLSSRIIIGGCGATPPGGFRAAGPKM